MAKLEELHAKFAGLPIRVRDRLVMVVGRLDIDLSADGLVFKELCIELAELVEEQRALINEQNAELNAAASNCKRMLDQSLKENRSIKGSLTASKFVREKLEKQIDELKNQLSVVEKERDALAKQVGRLTAPKEQS